ncbi:DUF1993 domain-containing protein [Comamonas sp. GB3 AK4-5]|uniref:DUF1993 domain-containing protein n=1 Tax=Comamonas sp. GB3 AK4-5 TaxID=3231487 RepID=UPI00351DD5E9
MTHTEIAEMQRIFTSRLDTLAHILDVAEKQLTDMDAALQERLAPDMFPLGTQIAFACNQPLGFAQWCQGLPIQNLNPDVPSLALARAHIRDTKAMLADIQVDDSQLDKIKRTGLGPGMYCETSGRFYVSDYLIPNFYFHIATTYAILRKLGVPLGKADFMAFLLPHVQREA